ncbi:MAG: DUF1553 domain-containing protein [Planctomycetales bacterium]|nr:DUF1553 domain-containing protein [Planctomycetales bacterium]
MFRSLGVILALGVALVLGVILALGQPASCLAADSEDVPRRVTDGLVMWFDRTGQGGAIRLPAAGTASAPLPGKDLVVKLKAANSLSIEAWLRPERLDQGGPARIMTLSSDTSHRNFTLGQDDAAIDVRLRTTKTSENGLPSLSSPPGSLKLERTHVVYVRDAKGGAALYLNGQRQATGNIAGELSNWDEQFSLRLGDEVSGGRPWRGEIQLAAIYARALSDSEVLQNFRAGADSYRQLAKRLPPASGEAVDFVRDIQPILRQRCYECHAKGNEESGLNLAMRARALEGGEHGPVLVAGDSLASPLIHWVAGVHQDGDHQNGGGASPRVMPPEGPRLTADQVGKLRAWIDQGATWPAGADEADPRLERGRRHWAFQRLGKPALPDGEEQLRAIDVWVARSWTDNHMTPAAPASTRALGRRIFFDLIGLPPNPEQLEAFVELADRDRADAVNALAEQLLAERHYGERWARHWLDVARYADSDGQEADRDRPRAYRYRDFVIRALNDDMPYDQFVRWQVAGDELAPAEADAWVATGFLTAGPHTMLADTFLEEERLRNRYNELDDIVSTLGNAMLGLTVGCARCHDHKFDAISSREYYRLLSAFHSGDRAVGPLPGGDEGLFYRDFGSEPRTTWLFGRGDFHDRHRQVQLGFPAVVGAGRDAAEYWRDVRMESSGATPSSTGQRAALALWLTDTQHGAGALLARVIVNRVWQHHFGEGLVTTVSDFGVRGEAPSHPELLEWLAADFVEHGWRLKRLHRQIVASAVYQLGDGGNIENAKRDPANRLLWRRPPQRLEAETLRDAMLAASGELNLKAFGPGFKPHIPAEAILARNLKDGGYPKNAVDNEETMRRSVYMFHKRVVPYPLLQAFDRPDLLQSCGRRVSTTVAPQALALLNNGFVRQRAAAFAARLLKSQADDREALVAEAFAIGLGREPNERERTASLRFLERQLHSRNAELAKEAAGADGAAAAVRLAVTDFCQSVFGLNEFIYVD